MKTEIIDKRINELRRRLAEVLLQLQDLTEQLKLDKELRVMREAFTMINNPFLFVVVGGVKAGKSSFINALLGENICKVDVKPCTDGVQEITFGEQENVEILGRDWKRITRPLELLKTIAIVDTPGTGAVDKRSHETLTKEYIPHSDLVIFVFMVKIPCQQSDWDLLTYAKAEWNRKVIFVLQQADLEQEHLTVQVESVKAYALQHGVADPIVFSTSAKWELDGQVGKSGFEPIREYIRKKVTGGTHLYEKLGGQIETASSVCEILGKSFAALRAQLETDKSLQNRIQSRLACGTGRSSKEIDALVDRLVTKYDSIANEFKKEFREGLDTGKIIKRIFPGSESSKQWLEGLQKRLNERLSGKLDEIAKQEAEFFIEDVKNLIKELLNDLEKITSPKDAFNTAEQINKRRGEIAEGVKTKLCELSQNTDAMQKGLAESANDLSTAVASGGVLTIIGAIIAAITKLALFDITGGILTAIGLSIAGITLLWKRGRVIEQFESGLDKGKKQLEEELKAKLSVNLRGVYREIEKVFQSFFDDIKIREDELRPQMTLLEKSKTDLLTLSGEIKN